MDSKFTLLHKLDMDYFTLSQSVIYTHTLLKPQMESYSGVLHRAKISWTAIDNMPRVQ